MNKCQILTANTFVNSRSLVPKIFHRENVIEIDLTIQPL